jgi:hypothetical protein
MGFSRLLSVLPYLALVACNLIQAVVFILLNGPLLLPLLESIGEHKYAELVESGLLNTWAPHFVSSARSTLDASALLLATIAVGFALNAFAQMLALLVSGGTQWMVRKWLPNFELFLGGKGFLHEDYARFSAWIVRQRLEKLQWEWELFNYYLYWGVCLSLAFFCLATAWLARQLPWWLVLVTAALFVYCLFRSRSLQNFLTYGYQASKVPRKKKANRKKQEEVASDESAA